MSASAGALGGDRDGGSIFNLAHSIPVNFEALYCLEGERLERLSRNITFSGPLSADEIIGTVYLTNYKLSFSNLNKDGSYHELPLGFVDKVEILEENPAKGESFDKIKIFCKDVRSYVLKLPRSASDNDQMDGQAFFKLLKHFAFPMSRNALPFAFSYSEQFKENGWSIYDPVKEFKRLGVPNKLWKIVSHNNNYEISDGYPAKWAIPSAADDQEFLRSVAAFRSFGRIPILSWLHPSGHASLTRSSQPIVGVSGNRSADDEKYLQMILEANENASPAQKLFIVDARSQEYAAFKENVKGGGYEREDVYKNTELIFVGIPGIKLIQESFIQLKDGIENHYNNNTDDDDDKLTALFESSVWLDYLQIVISGALKIVDKIENQNTSVLVHCSAGMDKATQLSSLSMLLLDQYYRTIEGFQVLVEKEWLSCGHRFQNRVGHGYENNSDLRRSPIFLQWMDCVYQMTLQFPRAFEFNNCFLIAILEHLHSCRFGTFLYNCEGERVENDVKRKTVSLWSMINSHREEYLNLLYDKNIMDSTTNRTLFPSSAKNELKFWKEYYCRGTNTRTIS